MIRFDFAGKSVLVTGGSQGIGLGIAEAFAVAGASVHITGTAAEPHSYEADLSRFVYHQARLEDRSARQALVANLPEIDVLVNNAGIANSDEYTYEGYLRTMEVNLNAVVELSYAYREGLASRGGTIVNIGSVASFLSMRQYPAYTASKVGLMGFTRALADQWAANGIRVNLIAPGFIDTKIIDWVKKLPDQGGKVLRAIPARRWGTPADVAAAALFLASPEASYITGQSLPVDGGLMLR